MRFASLIACLSSSLAVGCIGPNCNTITDSCQKIAATRDNTFAKTHYINRATGQQYLIYGGSLMQRYINLPNKCRNYGVFDTTVVYEKTAHPTQLSSYFGNRAGFMTLGPTATTAKDIRAVDLGLSQTDYLGTFCFHPTIYNAVINFDCWAGFDGFLPGLYGRVRLPITYSHWNIHLANNGSATGFVEQFPANFVATTAVNSLSSGPVALNGQQRVGDIPIMNYGRIGTADAQWGVADIPVDIGFNPLLTERARCGGSLHVVIPTGTKHDGPFIFKPRVGYGRWQIGAQLGAQFAFFNKEDRSLTCYVECMASALMKMHECRLLGLRANDTSAFNHYLLLKDFILNADGSAIVNVDLERAANLLFQKIHIATTINADIAAWLAYQHHCYRFELGWQFVGRGADSVINAPKPCRSCSPCNSDLQEAPGACFGYPGHLYVIKGSQNEYAAGPTPDLNGYYKTNSNIQTLGTLANGLPALQLAALTAQDVVTDPALQPALITNAIVAAIGYEFRHECFTPVLSIGGFYEVGKHNQSMNMFGVFAKGGCAF